MTNTYAILCSTQDTASMTMHSTLLSLCSHTTGSTWHNNDSFALTDLDATLYTTDKHVVKDTSVYDDLDEPSIICLTKHASQSGIPSLTTHAPGNWGAADYGGEPDTVGVWPAFLTSTLLRHIKKEQEKRSLEVDVTLEATHHGPCIDRPVCFVEIGSTEKEWVREDFAQGIMSALVTTLSSPLEEHIVAIGIGGLHTAPRFTKRVLNGEYAFGHICPHYMLDQLTVEKVLAAMQRTTPRAQVIVVDWKGLRKHRAHVLPILEELASQGISIVKLK